MKRLVLGIVCSLLMLLSFQSCCVFRKAEYGVVSEEAKTTFRDTVFITKPSETGAVFTFAPDTLHDTIVQTKIIQVPDPQIIFRNPRVITSADERLRIRYEWRQERLYISGECAPDTVRAKMKEKLVTRTVRDVAEEKRLREALKDTRKTLNIFRYGLIIFGLLVLAIFLILRMKRT